MQQQEIQNLHSFIVPSPLWTIYDHLLVHFWGQLNPTLNLSTLCNKYILEFTIEGATTFSFGTSLLFLHE